MSQLYFDNKYKSKGGLKKLKKMMLELRTLREICEHFGVGGRDRARQWIKTYFNMTYDPRAARRRKKIDEILDMFRKIGTEKTMKKLGDKRSHYIQLALEEYQKEIKQT